jgi:hypothetical protein
MTKHRIYTTSFASVYPHYVAKAERKGRTKAEVDNIIRWLTGYSQMQLDTQIKKQTDVETFFAEAPQMNPLRILIKGVICGVRVEDIEEPTMQEVRYLDKLIDELAKGKAMEKILRKQCATQRPAVQGWCAAPPNRMLQPTLWRCFAASGRRLSSGVKLPAKAVQAERSCRHVS